MVVPQPFCIRIKSYIDSITKSRKGDELFFFKGTAHWLFGAWCIVSRRDLVVATVGAGDAAFASTVRHNGLASLSLNPVNEWGQVSPSPICPLELLICFRSISHSFDMWAVYIPRAPLWCVG